MRYRNLCLQQSPKELLYDPEGHNVQAMLPAAPEVHSSITYILCNSGSTKRGNGERKRNQSSARSRKICCEM